jgi:hypothetical protein
MWSEPTPNSFPDPGDANFADREPRLPMIAHSLCEPWYLAFLGMLGGLSIVDATNARS